MKNTNGGTPAFATSSGERGMTKREFIATKLMAPAMSKLIGIRESNIVEEKILEAVKNAIKATDVLMAELEK